MSSVVSFPPSFPVHRTAASTRQILSVPADRTRDELSRLVDGLQRLALTQPAAVIAVKEIVYGLLATDEPHI